ncbi:MAG: DegT/DnrJ/EryC1/StrS family aminotransferase [Actinobacteria bacterium]|nr:DegT/DnrJ/EryC1/StrS family aminotransferase [Actinomycetota bacterium]
MLRLAEPRFGPEALEAIGQVLASGHLTQGPVVAEFEAAVAAFCGVRHGVATTSATTALELVLAALDIGPGDEVIAADFTYPATGNAVLQRGAALRLADADASTYCVAPDAIEALLSPRTKAVLAVDVFGLPADYAAIEPLLEHHGVPLVCDAACSLGGALDQRRCGSFGRAGCFSFHPRKSLTTGEGGMVVTDDDALAERMRELRNHGTRREGWRSTFVEPGFNYRMSDLNAALGLVQVPAHESTVRTRNALAARLSAQLERVDGIRPQHVPVAALHPYQAYVVTCDPALERDALIAALREQGVESTLGTYAMHAEPAFARACGTAPGDLPVSDALARSTLALPLHQGLTEADIDTVARALDAAVRQLPAR